MLVIERFLIFVETIEEGGEMKIKRIWFADNRIYGETEEGKVLWQSLLYYKRLLNAIPEQRANYEMDDEGIYWEDLDEDVSFESFEYENPEPKGISQIKR